MQHLEGLNPQQKEAVLHTHGPLLIVAGAGAGKTKTITHRIAHLVSTGVPAWTILAVTFTNKAATEMRERVERLLAGAGGGKPFISTFHSLGVRLLREFHTEAGLSRGFSIWDRDDSIRAIKRIAEQLEIGDIPPRGILSVISRKKSDGLTAQQFSGETRSYREQAIARAWIQYEKALADEAALDFDDLLSRTLRLLENNPAVLKKLQNRFTHITIDEYQDTNRSQYEIARLLAGEAKNLCVVGDTDQNIYSWRGADIANLLAFEETFPGTKTVLLEQNYRSTRTILSAANAVIAKNKRRKEKNLFTENPTGEPIVVYGARNDIDEAWFVGQTVAKLAEEGTRPGDIAILYRENFQSRALEEAMLAFSIPYRVLGTRFFERAEVKDVLSYLRAALNPKSKIDLARIIAVPPRGIGKVTLEKMLRGESPGGAAQAKIEAFQTILRNIKHACETLPASEAVRYALEESGIEKMLKGDKIEGSERLGNVYELINLAIRYDELLPQEGIERLLEEAALQSEQDSIKDEHNAVSLMTVHASKGLEFDAVFVTGLEQGLFPSLRADDGNRDNEEERRLFYVALTRAKSKLFLSYARQRMKYGQQEYTTPSEFLEDIDERLTQYASPRQSLLDEVIID